MAKSDSPKIYAGMLKRELLDVARRLGIQGVSRLKKADLLQLIQTALRRPKKDASEASSKPSPKTAAPVPEPAASKTGAAKSVPNTPRQRDATSKPQKQPEQKPQKQPEQKPQKAPAPRATSASARAVPVRAPEASPQPETSKLSDQSRATATKYGRRLPFPEEDLRHLDAALPGLPDGYGEDRLVLLPRDPEWLFSYWDIRNETKDEARRRGGVTLALRLFELRGGRLEPLTEHWVQEYARTWYLRVPSPGQTYVTEIGYRDGEGGWFALLRSNAVSVPPAGPSPIISDQFVTIVPDEPLEPTLSSKRRGRPRGATPSHQTSAVARGRRVRKEEAGTVHEAAYAASMGSSSTSVPGSAPGSMVGLPSSPRGHLSSSGGTKGTGATPAGTVETRGLWLMAEAELVVFGATDPKAELFIGGETIRLRSDGSFSVRMAYPEGTTAIPIVAVAEDRVQRQGLTMRFDRSTDRGSVPKDGR